MKANFTLDTDMVMVFTVTIMVITMMDHGICLFILKGHFTKII
jgi:hypothetical protein